MHELFQNWQLQSTIKIPFSSVESKWYVTKESRLCVAIVLRDFATKFVINGTNLSYLQCMNVCRWAILEKIAKDLCENTLALFFVSDENK